MAPKISNDFVGGYSFDNDSNDAFLSSSMTSPRSNEVSKSSSHKKNSKVKSLKDRAKVPGSLYLSMALISTAHYCGDIWSPSVLQNWIDSMVDGGRITTEAVQYLKGLTKDAMQGKIDSWYDFGRVCVFTGLVTALLYLLFVAPFRAGFWTGSRSTKHKMHRYMGLAYLIQYFVAWAQYIGNYDAARQSYLSHFIALNGVIQGYSAFFSFKVLPELEDPGYYSDKAVVSRSFVHENIFFSMMAVFGSIYYNDEFRHNLKSHPAGRVVESLFVFFPYVAIRQWFPRTKFSSAGKGRMGRTEKNERFYDIGTRMIKFFYLWAKYFLGFFINFLVYLEAPSKKDWEFLHGLYLLNLGTISIAVFLHTLRFKKVLPAKLTFSIYLLQIYATFSAIPLAYNMFTGHLLLSGVCFAGIVLNMTRKHSVHVAWCCCVFYLLKFRDEIEW